MPNSQYLDFLTDGLINIAGQSENEKYLGTINLTYNYRITKLIGVGAAFSYAYSSRDWVDGKSSPIKESRYYYTVMPRVKFEWLRKGIITLYSAVAAGVTIFNDTADGKSDNSVFFNYQASPIGIEIGNTIGGFAELGVGQLGIAQLGVRARF